MWLKPLDLWENRNRPWWGVSRRVRGLSGPAKLGSRCEQVTPVSHWPHNPSSSPHSLTSSTTKFYKHFGGAPVSIAGNNQNSLIPSSTLTSSLEM